jgi:HEPN domain-containing protein
MSEHYKTWIDSALYDLSVAIYLHQGGKWLHASINAQQAGEKLGKSILILSGISPSEIKALSHRITQINDKIAKLGLYEFNEADIHQANVMQRMYMSEKYPDPSIEDAPHKLFDRIDSEASIQWAVDYLDMAINIMPGIISSEQRDEINKSFVVAKEIINICSKCNNNPCVCNKAGSSGFKP